MVNTEVDEEKRQAQTPPDGQRDADGETAPRVESNREEPAA
jgi:hypothetical protein